MSKKFQVLFALLLVFSMVMSACGAPAAEPVVEAPAAEVTEAPAVVTEAPVVETAPDAQALFGELVNSLPADKGYGTVKPASLNEEMVDKAPFLLDVRETTEIEKDGYIEGAVNIPVREVLNNLDKLPGLDEPIVIYCASGHRGGFAMAALKLLGYTNVRNLAGGLGGWNKINLPVVTGSMPAEPAVINSAAIIEDQVLFEMLNGFLTELPEDFYTIKSDKLAEALTGEAPTIVDIRTAEEFAKDGYIEGAINVPMSEIFSSLDKLPAKDAPIVVHCVSGHRGAFVTMGLRLLGYTNVVNLAGGLNAWKAANMPVKGWVNWPVVWDEYLTNIPEGYYTIKAADLNTDLVENAPFLLDVRESGEIEKDGFIAGAVNIPVREVLNNLDKLPAQDQPIVIYCASGARGAMAMAALQMLGYTNVRNLAGGLGGWKKAELAVEMGTPAAPVAGTAPTVDEARLTGLQAFFKDMPEGFYTVKAADLNTELAGTAPYMVDLRIDEEYAAGYIEGANHITINTLPASLASLPTDKTAPIVAICQSGHRGALAVMYLRMAQGYTNVRNLAGGMNAWVAAELPVVK